MQSFMFPTATRGLTPSQMKVIAANWLMSTPEVVDCEWHAGPYKQLEVYADDKADATSLATAWQVYVDKAEDARL